MNLSTKILIGLGLGIIAGLELGAEGVDFAKTWIGPFGTIFMNMIKMIIVPLVFSSLVIGVCSLGISKRSAVSAAKLWLIIWELRHLRLYLVYF